MSVPTRKQTQDYERSFLGDYEGPCPICGHTLKNPTGGRCPECGSRLQIGLFAPFRFTPWHAMLASVGISIGIILDRVALTIVGIANSNGAGGAEQMFWFTLIPLLFLGLCFYVVWGQKNRLNSTEPWKRVCWYVASIVIPIIVVIGQLYGLLWLAMHG